jgi:hypothetical protein
VTRSPRRRATLAVITGIVLLVPRAATTQSPTRLTGHVLDRATHTGIAGATISVPALGRKTVSDSSGRYVIGGFAPGTIRLVVRVLPFRAAETTLRFNPGEQRWFDFALDSAPDAAAAQLPVVPVTAAAPADYRLVDFERRRKTGRGQYLTDDEIKRMNAANLQDAMRGMRGVEFHCGGGPGGCQIQMSRAPLHCAPEYIVDGHLDNSFGPSTPIRDVVGLEVYTGPADLPADFSGATAGCGVIAVWTRSGPPPRKR